MSMLEKRGTHSTSKSRAVLIGTQGFTMTKGRGGTGVYFWAESRYSKKLAIGWYRQSLSEGQYRGDKDQGGVVIYVILQVDETQYLDLEDPVLKDAIGELADAQGLGANPTNKQVAALYDVFIKEMEKEQKKTYNVLSVRVAPPKHEFLPDYSIKILGAPICHMVRALECILISEIEDI